MYNGDWGHVGKLDYLRTQFKALGLNFMGIQEARTPESCSRSQDVYRPQEELIKDVVASNYGSI